MTCPHTRTSASTQMEWSARSQMSRSRCFDTARSTPWSAKGSSRRRMPSTRPGRSCLCKLIQTAHMRSDLQIPSQGLKVMKADRNGDWKTRSTTPSFRLQSPWIMGMKALTHQPHRSPHHRRSTQCHKHHTKVVGLFHMTIDCVRVYVTTTAPPARRTGQAPMFRNISHDGWIGYRTLISKLWVNSSILSFHVCLWWISIVYHP